MYSTFSEKSPLLPVTEPSLDIVADIKDERRRRSKIEYGLLMSTLSLTTLQFLVLHSADGSVPVTLDDHCSVLVAQLARGLRTSIPASLPTAAILFIVAPYLAQKERVVIVRYAILVFYLVGSMLGALLLL